MPTKVMEQSITFQMKDDFDDDIGGVEARMTKFKKGYFKLYY